jgi:hypothetical protein
MVEVTRHHPFTEQLEATHFGFNQAAPMIAGSLFPYFRAKAARMCESGRPGF